VRLWKQALVSLALLGAAGYLWARHFPAANGFLERAGITVALVEPPAAEASAGQGPRAGQAPVVLGAPVGEAKVNDAVFAIGDGRAARSVTLTPYDDGRVARVNVESGDLVSAGAALIELDSDAEAIALDRARLTLDDAKVTLARTEALVKSRALSEVQLSEVRLAVDQAELAVRDAELALEHRVVRAPFAGWVGILGVDVGDQVGTDTEIATLDDRSHILVDFRVPERFVGQVRVGAPVEARPLARPDLELAGEVVTLDARVDAATRTLRVRASLGNDDDALRAGMAFSIRMRFPGETLAAIDPLAIQWSADGAYVWIAVDGKAERVPVRIVQRGDDAVLVDAALAPGTMVVTQGVQMLRDGAPFRFEHDTPPATAEDPAPGGGVPSRG
jgi:RND family efflux transporter MFP subunit